DGRRVAQLRRRLRHPGHRRPGRGHVGLVRRHERRRERHRDSVAMTVTVVHPDCAFTPNEAWAEWGSAPPWYKDQALWTVEALGEGEGRRCLVAGSPLFEAGMLMNEGWF